MTTDWDKIEQEQRERFKAATAAGYTGEMPLFVSDLRMEIQRAREIGGDREHWLEVLTPSPSDRGRGALTPTRCRLCSPKSGPPATRVAVLVAVPVQRRTPQTA